MQVAGFTAAGGASLEEVAAAAQAVAGRVFTLGCALSVCTVPGGATSARLDGSTVEVPS